MRLLAAAVLLLPCSTFAQPAEPQNTQRMIEACQQQSNDLLGYLSRQVQQLLAANSALAKELEQTKKGPAK